jgi:hypothetical protein
MQLEDLESEFDWVAMEFSKKTPYKVTKFIGSGEHGNAYVTDDDKVVKITTDKSEYDESRKLLGKNPVHLPKIYDCFSVESKRIVRPLWIIVLEHVEHNRKEQEYLFNHLMDAFEDDLGLNLMDELSGYQVDVYSTDEMVDYLNHLDISDDVVDYYGQIISMIDEMKRYGVKSIDYGPNNFGFRGDTLVFFDLGFGEEEEGGTHKKFKI